MRKIISLFRRDYRFDRLVYNELVPGAEWVAAGEGIATRKFDGTCCMWSGGRLWKRYELKAGKEAPIGFLPAQEPDMVTGDIPGWLPVGEGPEDQWHREALASAGVMENGTYELCGPCVQKNPEGFDSHVLIRHGDFLLPECPRTFDGLCKYLREHNIEGVVWHHHDGRMVKIKGKDFGIRRVTTPPQAQP